MPQKERIRQVIPEETGQLRQKKLYMPIIMPLQKVQHRKYIISLFLKDKMI